jgi:RHS repeat-associated protein
VRRHEYLPFGEEWEGPSGAGSLRFTGQARDNETGLHYFGARYYQAELGRFTTPDDPGFMSLWIPVSTNLFAYALGNPLRWIDPSGHSAQCPTDYCVDVSAPLPRTDGVAPGFARFLWDSWFRGMEIASTAGSLTQEGARIAVDWVAAPRDPTCMAASIMGGAAVGAALGGSVGIMTGPGELALLPVGTMSGGVRGTIVGLAACMSGTGPGGGGHLSRNNRHQNAQFLEATRRIERALGGRRLRPDQVERLHREVSGEGYSLQQIVDLGIAMFK